jgi:hypothetical protein
VATLLVVVQVLATRQSQTQQVVLAVVVAVVVLQAPRLQER